MQTIKTKKMVTAALFAALTCIATMTFHIPSPMNGYVHLGDAFVLMAAWLLSPAYGCFAAGVGSMLADVFSGYLHYAPGTLLIKAAFCLVAYLVYTNLKKNEKNDTLAFIISGISGGVVMIFGYFGYTSLLLGRGLSAAASIPGNIVQATFAIVCATIVVKVLKHNKILQGLNA